MDTNEPFYTILPNNKSITGALVIVNGNFNWGPDKFRMQDIEFRATKVSIVRQNLDSSTHSEL